MAENETGIPQGLEALAQFYPTAASAAAEAARLHAMLGKPRHREYLVSDIHGEYDEFRHILRSGSGAVRALIDDVFGDEFPPDERQALAAVAYYPEASVAAAQQAGGGAQWYVQVICGLLVACRNVAAGYSHEYVYDVVDGDLAPLVEEMLVAGDAYPYVTSAVLEGLGPSVIVELSQLIRRLVVDHVHVVGDIYDRGPAPDAIMDMLMGLPSVDVQWGNHDIVWMGAALGQRGCIAHVVRNCARYGNLDILTDAYGMDLSVLRDFATTAYADDPCAAFALKVDPGLSAEELDATVKIQKAMAIIQFKVEAQLIDAYPGFDLADRKLLGRIDYDAATVVVDGVEYELTDTYFPTVDRDDPYTLTLGEEEAMRALEAAFLGCERLQEHIRFLLHAGSLYKVSNGKLMLHACVPLNDDGSLKEVDVFGERYAGRALYDKAQECVRLAFESDDDAERARCRDLIWYLWLGQGSPLFAKSKMATFEIYLCRDKAARKEEKNAFYKLFDKPEAYDAIFRDFGLDPETSRIICGHTPVKVKDGEDPVRANGKVICIDGGMSPAYQKTTGIAGFTLVDDANALTLYAHEPFAGEAAVVGEGADLVSHARVVEAYGQAKTMGDTDEGEAMRARIADLRRLAAFLDAQG